MARQLSTTTRNRYRDAWVAAFPAGTFLRLYTGAPSGVGNAPSGTLLVEITLPASPWTSTNGQVAKNGTWSAAASASGIAQSYRLINGTDIEEGNVGEGSGDLSLDNTDIATGQTVTVNTFTRIMPDA